MRARHFCVASKSRGGVLMRTRLDRFFIDTSVLYTTYQTGSRIGAAETRLRQSGRSLRRRAGRRLG
jgi:hypothetical protein